MRTTDQPADVSPRTGGRVSETATSPATDGANSRQYAAPSGSAVAEGNGATGAFTSVEFHIDELILDGFEPAHRYAIGEAIEQEFQRLLQQDGALAGFTQNIEVDSLNAGEVGIGAGQDVKATGIRLARAIYQGLGNR